MLGTVTLIAGSFLIGRFVGVSQDDNDDKKDNNTSEVANTETSDVFDSTDEEIEAIKEEQEQLEQENEEKIEEVKEELQQTEREKDFSNEVLLTQNDGTQCEISVIYATGAVKPYTYKGAIVLEDADNYDTASASVFCENNPVIEKGSSSIDKNDIRDFLAQGTFGRVSNVTVSNNPNDVDNGFASYDIFVDNDAYRISLRTKKTDPIVNFRINVPIREYPQVITTEAYTNQFYPNLKFVYPSDWSLNSTTRPIQGSDNVVSRSIYLEKSFGSENVTINATLMPLQLYIFDDTLSRFNNTLVTELSNGFQEYNCCGKTGTRTYTDRATTPDIITSNIITKDADFGDDNDASNLEFAIDITAYKGSPLAHSGEDLTLNQEQLNEIRSIIENSTFR